MKVYCTSLSTFKRLEFPTVNILKQKEKSLVEKLFSELLLLTELLLLITQSHHC